MAETASRGSSPLARGLRDVGDDGRSAARIIPARAGFTRRRHPRTSGSTDHPRSRGVYQGAAQGAAIKAGSSPLARGLRASRERIHRGPRIIPARAGFTGRTSVRGEDTGDHPRSRGVYPAADQARRKCGGSSPLARGLLIQFINDHHIHGIIPARAGFTTLERGFAGFYRDHPRSRGVYR